MVPTFAILQQLRFCRCAYPKGNTTGRITIYMTNLAIHHYCSSLRALLFWAVLTQLVVQMVHPLLAHSHDHRKHCEAQNEQHFHDETYTSHACDFCATLLKKFVYTSCTNAFFASLAYSPLPLSSHLPYADIWLFGTHFHAHCPDRAPPTQIG
jgi:hypothetical protein